MRRRENVRADAGNSDDYLNDEELAADAAVNDTFLRIVANASDEMFTVIFDKLQKYLRGKIVEPNVAGGILASMCKSVVQARPAAGLAFFVPYLSESITRWGRRCCGKFREMAVVVRLLHYSTSWKIDDQSTAEIWQYSDQQCCVAGPIMTGSGYRPQFRVPAPATACASG